MRAKHCWRLCVSNIGNISSGEAKVFLLEKRQGKGGDFSNIGSISSQKTARKGGGVAISEVFPLSWQIGEANKYFFSKNGNEREGVTISEVFLLK